MTDEQFELMEEAARNDADLLQAAGAYGALLKAVDARLPADDRWLLDDLDEAHGAQLHAQSVAVARWGLAQAQGGAL